MAETEKTFINTHHSNHQDFDLNKLISNGYMNIKGLIDTSIISATNDLLTQKLNIDDLKKLPGFKMGNLAIDSCYIHNQLWTALKDSGLIKSIVNQFGEYKYVSFGGNLNLPKSKKQRLHVDSVIPNLTINIPLVDVFEANGAMSVIDGDLYNPYSTLEFFKKRLYTKSKLVCSRRGDVILRFANTWHRGNPNTTKDVRMMLSFTLRKDFVWADKGDLDEHLILKKNETREVSFSGNIYPDSSIGRFLEGLDYRFPSISRTAINLRNIMKGI